MIVLHQAYLSGNLQLKLSSRYRPLQSYVAIFQSEFSVIIGIFKTFWQETTTIRPRKDLLDVYFRLLFQQQRAGFCLQPVLCSLMMSRISQ